STCRLRIGSLKETAIRSMGYGSRGRRHTGCIPSGRGGSVRGGCQPMRGAAASLGAIGALILLGLPVGARAGNPGDEVTQVPKPPPRAHRVAEILKDMNDAVRTDRTEPGNFHIRKGSGFEYTHRFEGRGGTTPVIFGIQGPVLGLSGSANPRKRLGVSFEI